MFFSDLVYFLIGEKTNLDIQKRSFLKISSSFTISKSLPFKIIFSTTKHKYFFKFKNILSTRPKRWQVCPKDDVNSRITWKYFRYSRLKGSILLRQFRVFRGALYRKGLFDSDVPSFLCTKQREESCFLFRNEIGETSVHRKHQLNIFCLFSRIWQTLEIILMPKIFRTCTDKE